MSRSKSLWPGFLAFLGPMMVANVLQSLSGTVNNVFLGQMIGVHALAAASAFFPVIFLLMSFLVGLGSGTSILIGQAWGAQQVDRIKAIAGTTLVVTVAGGIVIGGLGIPYAESIMRALGTPSDILPEAVAYAKVMLVSMPAMFVFFAITTMLRGVGDTITPLWTLAVSTTIGLIVTPALISGWGGLPKMGVVSAAYANIVATLVALVWLSIDLRRRNSPLAPDAAFFAQLRVDPAILRQVLRLGIPTAIQMIVMSIAGIVLLGLVNGFGSSALAAYGAVNQVVSYVQFPAFSIAIAASILGAQAIGGDRNHELGSITRIGILLNLALTGTLVVIAYVFSHQILGIFIPDPHVIAIAEELLHIVLWSIVLFGMSAAIAGVMRSSGAVLVPMLISIGVIVIIEVPAAWYFSRLIGIDGIWYAYAATFTTMFLLNAAYYRFVWRHQPIRKLEYRMGPMQRQTQT